MKLNRGHSISQTDFQTRLQAQRAIRRNATEKIEDFPQPESDLPSLFKSTSNKLKSVDDIVVLGNKHFENLDNIDFAGFRNDTDLGKKTLREVRMQVGQFHSDRSSPEYKRDVSRVLNARYLQGHGIQVESHLDFKEMGKLRRYIQKETSSNNVADAARAINSALAQGTEDVGTLQLGAEQHLFSERGLNEVDFADKYAKLKFKDLAKIRDFADAWSTSQAGKYLTRSKGDNFDANRDTMARDMLDAHGYRGTKSLTLDTVLSLLRDIDAEGPNTNATIRNTVNSAVAEGEKDYFVLNTLANKAILGELGLDEASYQSLDLPDEDYLEQYPDLAPREARAIRTRVLRDLLRVLPDDSRELTMQDLTEQGSNLIEAEDSIKKFLGTQIRELAGHGATYSDMGAMQRANFTAALKKLPDSTRESVFSGTPIQSKNRLEKLIESQFGIEVHRKAGEAPNGDPSFAPFVKDWTAQGLVDLHNAMSTMAKDGKLPETLIGNATVCFVQGSPESPSMSVGPQPIDDDPRGPFDRPGAGAHASGKSGFFGMAGPDDTGHDIVYLFDDALLESNADSAQNLTIGESTLVHEFGHAIQLGGTPGADEDIRSTEEQFLVAEWSSLSRWTEPQNVLADGRMGTFEYYYDPTVQVANRQEVATSYGASDPVEDFAEYTPYFFAEPETAMALSAEKFLYYNQMVGQHYSADRIKETAAKLGLTSKDLAKAEESMTAKVVDSPVEAGLIAS